MNRQTKANHGTDKYIVYVGNTAVPVNKDVFDLIRRDKENQRYRARRDGKCGTSNYHLCHGDCGHCKWVREGYNMLSLDKAFSASTNGENEDDLSSIESIPDTNASLITDIVADRDILDRLVRKLDSLVPNGGKIVRMLMEGYTDRQMTKALKLPRQSTLNYRKRKVQQYLREHWDDFFN